MPDRCQLYYITDRSQFPGDELARRRALLAKVAEAASAGIDYIQLREKDLSGRELETLARESAHIIQNPGNNRRPRTRLLINSRTDIALAVGADGVHLRSADVSPATVRALSEEAAASGSPLAHRNLVVAVSAHAASDVRRAAAEGADFVVFAPVFEKRGAPQIQATGLAALREACTSKIPVFALGGVTLENAPLCLAAGAAGVAGIRLFQEQKIEDVVVRLRSR
ncbi:MAG: thiamine phosphate synthase [Terriglobales bacterium]